ncbi:2-amino-4-hydroxy-6-hydroxymethyldihydropteridine diphosphokinase [Natranaerofaba carboxydovora]|uniref:2-amino-4-hydroxy-6- hydroxymethyldihydropteridine diphosphokinase n=1 Tax=Natranaerofaba carboxydovora TaxID=2742683 RepID=UPI001F12B8E2|nr:2-amino-4-hydroxy-6-hydroxymethyldihydropteridine diphosphokinase [Natranaerofaba carboxydovora]UMZ74916.1 2-amino-4-hydroxy-6-hydroxymethyldihydropteridine pyrophosphokinase [Natranaerofaba carboxydovora]
MTKKDKNTKNIIELVEVYLSLGTNVGDRLDNLRQAVSLISEFESCEIIKVSGVYETKPWGYTEQDDFYNLCICMQTELPPYELLNKCQQVEKELDRKRDFKWGPRTMDVDILLYGDLTNEDETLTIPHKHMHERAFVLYPLMDIDKDLIVKDKTIEEWCELLDDEEKESITLFSEKLNA